MLFLPSLILLLAANEVASLPQLYAREDYAESENKTSPVPPPAQNETALETSNLENNGLLNNTIDANNTGAGDVEPPPAVNDTLNATEQGGLQNATGLENSTGAEVNVTAPEATNNVTGNGNIVQIFNNIQIQQIQVNVVNLVFNTQIVIINTISCKIFNSRALDGQGQQQGTITPEGKVVDNTGNPQQQAAETQQKLDSLAKIGQNLAGQVQQQVDIQQFTGIEVTINNEICIVQNGVVLNNNGETVGQVDPQTGDVKDLGGNAVQQAQNVQATLKSTSDAVIQVSEQPASTGGGAGLAGSVDGQGGLAEAFNQVVQAVLAMKKALGL